jgi:hypothetical protein
LAGRGGDQYVIVKGRRRGESPRLEVATASGEVVLRAKFEYG